MNRHQFHDRKTNIVRHSYAGKCLETSIERCITCRGEILSIQQSEIQRGRPVREHASIDFEQRMQARSRVA